VVGLPGWREGQEHQRDYRPRRDVHECPSPGCTLPQPHCTSPGVSPPAPFRSEARAGIHFPCDEKSVALDPCEQIHSIIDEEKCAARFLALIPSQEVPMMFHLILLAALTQAAPEPAAPS